MARHCDRLFPPDLAGTSDNPQAAAARVWRKFTALRKKIERKRLASELELKMRAVYYDVIDPAAVEGYIAFIYRQVECARGGGGEMRELAVDLGFSSRHARNAATRNRGLRRKVGVE